MLEFTDGVGNEGEITDDFSTDYDGPVPVEPYVAETLDDAASDEQAVEALLLDMVHDLNVVEVRRNESGSFIDSERNRIERLVWSR